MFFVPKLVPYTNGRLMTDKNIQIIITLCAWCDSEMSKRKEIVACKSYGLTQIQTVKKLGCAQSTVSKFWNM